MDFTREPIIETVITPKEGCKIVVRSSKSAGQEEYFVDSVEVVSFGNSLFFRSLERPKAFLVPVSDYEILEVREARMVLKNVGLDRSIKIGGGREANVRTHREAAAEKAEAVSPNLSEEAEVEPTDEAAPAGENKAGEKKRDRRRHYRRRRGREEGSKEGGESSEEAEEGHESKVILPPPLKLEEGEEKPFIESLVSVPTTIPSLLPPPPMLISETIRKYKDLYKDAFFVKEEEKTEEQPVSSQETELTDPSVASIHLEEPKPVEEHPASEIPLDTHTEEATPESATKDTGSAYLSGVESQPKEEIFTDSGYPAVSAPHSQEKEEEETHVPQPFDHNHIDS